MTTSTPAPRTACPPQPAAQGLSQPVQHGQTKWDQRLVRLSWRPGVAGVNKFVGEGNLLHSVGQGGVGGCCLRIPKIQPPGRHPSISHQLEAGLRELWRCYWPHGCSHLVFSFLQFRSKENGMPPPTSPSLYASWLRPEMESTGGVEQPQWPRAWLLRLEREDSSTVLNG